MTPNIFLHKYNSSIETTTAFSAPHKYRFSKRLKIPTENCERAWQSVKINVLLKLNEEIEKLIDSTRLFAFAVAPSNTRLFIDDIEKSITVAFPIAINLSRCFTKLNNFEARVTNKILNEEELRMSFTLSNDCYNEIISSEIKQILLIDNVYLFGNTLNGMQLLVSDIDNSKEIITAVILKTT